MVDYLRNYIFYKIEFNIFRILGEYYLLAYSFIGLLINKLFLFS